VKNSSSPLPPREISRMTGINPSTTRVYVRDLLKLGHLFQPIPGYYAVCPTYGVGVGMSAKLVHDLCLVDDGCKELRRRGKMDDVKFDIGSIKFHYEFGRKRGKFTCRLSCDEGLDFNGLCLALDRVYSDFRGWFGREPVFVCSLHLNRDFGGIELSSVKSYMRKGLLGFFKRVYQKEDGLVRAEVGLNGLGVDEMVSLVIGDLNYFEFAKNVDDKLDSILKMLKFRTRIFDDQSRSIEKISRILSVLIPSNPYEKPGLNFDDSNPLVS